MLQTEWCRILLGSCLLGSHHLASSTFCHFVYFFLMNCTSYASCVCVYIVACQTIKQDHSLHSGLGFLCIYFILLLDGSLILRTITVYVQTFLLLKEHSIQFPVSVR